MTAILLKNCDTYSPLSLGIKDILIEDGLISKVDKINIRKSIQKIIDCKGYIVCPGFIDLHVHGAGGFEIFDASVRSLNGMSVALAKTGVTSFLATTMLSSQKNQNHIENCASYVKAKKYPGSQMLGIHLEGPFISSEKKGMIKSDSIFKLNEKNYSNVSKICSGTLRIMTIAPELKGSTSIIKKLVKSGCVASIGHTMAKYLEAKVGISAGASHVTHFFNAMPQLHQREPGVIGAVFEEKSVTVQVITDGVHLHPSILRLVYKLFTPDRICFISDGLASLGLPDGKYFYRDVEYTSVNGTCYYKDGTLIGTTIPLNKAALRFKKFTGASIADCIKMLSTVPALTIGEKNKGKIEKGKDADLVIMDNDFKIFKTIIKGKVI